MRIEYWKDIPGYEGLYQISSLGRVKSVDRLVGIKNGSRLSKGTFLKERICKAGYCIVDLWKDNKRKAFQVHRLVASAFIPNPNNFPVVNHKSGDRTENTVDNLEWCTQSYNNTYNNLQNRIHKNQKKSIIQCSLDGTELCYWFSTRDCQQETGFDHSAISAACKGKYKQAYGFKWKYAI